MADDAGEKMLSNETLVEMRAALNERKATLSERELRVGWHGQREEQLLDHIAALSATIKRLETPVADGDYLIWSNEHRAWWRPNSAGYTVRLAAAGRYDRDAAIFICRGARHGWKDGDVPTEIPVREFDAKHAALSLNSVETREMKP